MSTVRAAAADEMPILDLTALNDGGDIAPIAAKMRHACVTTGFFYVANHGIPTQVIDGLFATTRRYFDFRRTDVDFGDQDRNSRGFR